MVLTTPDLKEFDPPKDLSFKLYFSPEVKIKLGKKSMKPNRMMEQLAIICPVIESFVGVPFDLVMYYIKQLKEENKVQSISIFSFICNQSYESNDFVHFKHLKKVKLYGYFKPVDGKFKKAMKTLIALDSVNDVRISCDDYKGMNSDLAPGDKLTDLMTDKPFSKRTRDIDLLTDLNNFDVRHPNIRKIRHIISSSLETLKILKGLKCMKELNLHICSGQDEKMDGLGNWTQFLVAATNLKVFRFFYCGHTPLDTHGFFGWPYLREVLINRKDSIQELDFYAKVWDDKIIDENRKKQMEMENDLIYQMKTTSVDGRKIKPKKDRREISDQLEWGLFYVLQKIKVLRLRFPVPEPPEDVTIFYKKLPTLEILKIQFRKTDEDVITKYKNQTAHYLAANPDRKITAEFRIYVFNDHFYRDDQEMDGTDKKDI